MINITLFRKDGTTISAMQLAQAADAVERTFKIFMCDTSRSDPEDFRQFADEIEKKAKKLARLSREWADGLDEAYGEDEGCQEEGAAYGYDAKGDRVTLVEASKGNIPDWLKSGLATCATATESEVLLRAYDELQALGSSPH